MATTTFTGAVRSENGFQSITKNTTTGAVTVEATYDTRPNFRVTVDNSTLNTGAAVTTTLTTSQSGTIFEVDGTDDIVVNMPALSTDNVGITYEFFCNNRSWFRKNSYICSTWCWSFKLLWCFITYGWFCC